MTTKNTLHIVSKIGSQVTPSFSTFLKTCAKGDAIIFIGDGVFNLTSSKEALEQELKNLPIYALEDDIAARGVMDFTPAGKVDYKQFVELTTEYRKTMSW